MIRTHLVKALYENLLGPKMESEESIEEPFLKYELGILNSSFSPDVVVPENNSVVDDTPNQFEEGDTETTTNAEGTQVLDHLRREIDTDLSLLDGVSSVGISFVLEPKNKNENKIPQFKVCLTWGRYTRNVEFGELPKMFDRHPNYFVTEWINPTLKFKSRKLTEEAEGEERLITMNGASLHVLIIPIENSQKYIVRIFLVNETQYDTAGRQTEIERIFQPQIRVIVNDDANVGDLDDVVSIHNTDQENDDALLYRNLKTKAKGYLCAAVWKDVDPEFSDNDIKNITWKDSQKVPQKIKDDFTCPDVRTEYLPLYAILQPESPQSQEFNAKILSETWNQSDLELKLRSIEIDYGKWIESQKTKLDEEKNSNKINASLEKIGLHNIEECNKSKNKISEGVTFLINDKSARAAFCFMNSVMNDKRIAETSNNENLKWREFQMAFILQSLVGVTGENPDQRDIADVLWFPTGGGKTEAYLGIVIFALAYRRLSFNSTDTNLSNDGGVGVISRYTLRLLTVQQFQRALGAIVIADVKRVLNWLPEDAITGSEKITDPVLLKKLDDGNFWGNQRFSIGLWIGKDTTPNDFAIQPIWTGRQSKIIPHCEGALLPTTDPIHPKLIDGKSGKPDQIQNCPICKSILCIPNVPQPTREFTKLTWIVQLSKNKETVDKFTKEVFENYDVVLNTKPNFELISNPSATEFYYRLTMEIRSKMKSVPLDRDLIDKWWRDAVEKQLVNSDQELSLQSTSPSMPGYFFLKSGDKNYDFTLFCTNSECTLNQFEWFEKLENKYDAQIPPAFKIKNSKNISTSIPISAYVSDAQVYSKCPSFLITTVDKFARLPFEPKCASIFGNVDVIHPLFGYGRKSTIESPIRNASRAGRIQIPDGELDDVSGFNPPSLILQDELHLIEGPLGSMTGIYEMAIDVLCNNGLKPKYIASSATIKEAKSQVGTIFRKDVSIFPKPGINSFDNYFSRIEEDQSCVKERHGRLYLGMLSYKSAVYLPIKSQSIIMSEIFKIKKYPELYDLTSEERRDIDNAIDPYWTFVSYFTDLALLSKFTNWYKENIMELVPSLSTVQINNSLQRANFQTLESGLRFFSIVADKEMIIDSVSVFCTNDVGNIRIALYADGNPIGKKIGDLDSKRCTVGENKFETNDNVHCEIKNNDKIWVAVINDDSATQFESVNSPLGLFVTDPLTNPTDFPETLTNIASFVGDSIKITLNSSPRELNEEKNIPLSSETDSQQLVKHLEQLAEPLNIDSLQTSPVFGTGIDVSRLGIIQIMTQPKTNSGYIQSSGRVGRNNFGLVLTWLRAGRVRDLNHYENFVGYHRMIHKFVEPVTASPFSNEAIELCLGPVIIAILRNARKVNGVAIHNDWINQEGAIRMRERDGDDDVKSIKTALTDICSSNHIAVFRQMHPVQFQTILEEKISLWHSTAYHLFQDSKPLVYSETFYGPGKSPEQNVVLGTLTHKLKKLVTVFDEPPNSLRNTESTAQFSGADGSSEIRPSQFITRYGPGTLISADGRSLVIPSVQKIVADLKRQPDFEAPDLRNNRGLFKYEIEDDKMKRLLHRSNRNTAFRNLKLFRLPTNADLQLSPKDNLYHCDSFPKWVQCTSKLHKNVRILAKLEYSNYGEIVKCPKCQELSPNGNAESKKFIASKLVVACKEGHLGDVNWKSEVHANFTGNCSGDVFKMTTGSGDNTKWECMGHWNQNNFVRSDCDASVDNLELKNRSISGRIPCTTELVETGQDDPRGCQPVPQTNMSKAKLTNKYQMSIRLPIISTSMEFDTINSDLYNQLVKAKGEIVSHLRPKPEKENISKDDFVSWLKSMIGFSENITSDQVIAVELAKQEQLSDVLKQILEFVRQTNVGTDTLSEKQVLELELNTLENKTLNGGGVSISSGTTFDHDAIQFLTPFNLQFEAMAFDKIKVTQVQSGYTREITPPTPIGTPPLNRDFDRREGEVISNTEKLTIEPAGGGEQKWYIANQLRGEGIFIHLDPGKHSTAMDVFRNAIDDDDFITWTKIHDEIRNEVEPLLAQLNQNPIDNSQAIDELENKILKTNPLFVWWHSFAHEFINQLAVDSGFSGVSLGERVYWLKKGNERFAAGIFIFASSPGTDGTLGGLTSLVDQRILPVIVERTLYKMKSCSNDPICSSSKINIEKRNGAACHICLMNSETSCAYFNKFLDRNLVRGTL